MSPAQRIDFVAGFVRDVWTGGRIEACDEYLAAHYTIHHDPGDPWDGQVLDAAAFKERVRQSRAPFPDQSFDIRHALAGPDSVAIGWFWSATHAGDLDGFPATGRVLRMSGATVYSIDTGNRICGHWQVADRLGIFQQLQRR